MTDFLLEEALRYLGAARADEATRRAVAETAQTLRETISPRFVYRVFDLEKKGGAPFLPDAGLTLPGKLARRMLEGCGKAALLICTLGAGFDARMRHMQARDMAGAVILDACGSAWVEAGCREAEKAIAATDTIRTKISWGSKSLRDEDRPKLEVLTFWRKKQ